MNMVNAMMQMQRHKWLIEITKFLKYSLLYLMTEFLKFYKANNTIRI